MYGVVVAYSAADLADAVETLELVQHLERFSVAIEQAGDLAFGKQLVLVALFTPRTDETGALPAFYDVMAKAHMRSVLWIVDGAEPPPALRAAAGETLAATGNPGADRETLTAAVRRVAKVRTHKEIVARETESQPAKRRRVASRASVMFGTAGAIGALALAGAAVWMFDTDPRFAPKPRYPTPKSAPLAPSAAAAAVPAPPVPPAPAPTAPAPIPPPEVVAPPVAPPAPPTAATIPAAAPKPAAAPPARARPRPAPAEVLPPPVELRPVESLTPAPLPPPPSSDAPPAAPAPATPPAEAAAPPA